MNKHITEWYKLITDTKIRVRAMHNYDPNFAIENGEDGYVDNIQDAINMGFDWYESPEGGTYWSDRQNDAYQGTLTTKVIEYNFEL